VSIAGMRKGEGGERNGRRARRRVVETWEKRKKNYRRGPTSEKIQAVKKTPDICRGLNQPFSSQYLWEPSLNGGARHPGLESFQREPVRTRILRLKGAGVSVDEEGVGLV